MSQNGQKDSSLPGQKPALNLSRKMRRRKETSRTPILVGIAFLALALFGLAVWRYVAASRAPVKIAEDWTRLLKVSNVYDILVDPFAKQLVWFATAEGVRLYNKDTGTWKSYGFADGLPSEQITCIAADSSRLWFGTWSGVAFLERSTNKWGRLALGDRVKQRKVLDLERDGSFLWVSTTDGGIDRYDLAQEAWENFGKESGFTTGELYCILVSDSAVYAGSNQGTVYVFDRASRKWGSLKNPKASSFVTKIWAMEQDGDDLWMGTSHKGVWQYNMKTGQWRTHEQTGAAPLILVYSLAVDSGWVWAGTPLGVVRYAKDSDTWIGEISEGALGKPYVMTTLANDEGYVWFGSYQQGLGKIMKDKPQVVPYSGGLEHDYVKTIGLGSNSVWLGYGYLGGWVDEFQKDSLVWKRNVNVWTGIPGENVNTVRCWGNDAFIGTWNGFAYFDSSRSLWISSKERFAFESEVTDAAKIDSTIYVGSQSGLFAFDPKRKNFAPVDTATHLSILALAHDSSRIWLGTRTGLFCLDLEIGRIDSITVLGTDPINSVAISGDSLWVGRLDKGVGIYSKRKKAVLPFNFEKTELIQRRPENKTLRVAQVRALDNRIWIATNWGIAVIDPQASKDFAITFSEGLINNDVLTIEADSTDYYFGLFGGVNRVSKSTLFRAIFSD